MSDQNDQELNFEEMSLDELLCSTKEDLARVDALMGTEGEPEVDESELTQPATLPRFQPRLPEQFEQDPVVRPEPEQPEQDKKKKKLFKKKEPKPESETASMELPESAEEPEQPPRTGLHPALKTLLYVCFVLAFSVLLAVAAWLCADDVLALTKPDTIVTVTVPENDSISDVSRELKNKGLINYDWLFKFYCWYSHAERKIVPGTYELNNLYDYHALVNGMMTTSGNRATATVTIPEGYECKDVFALLQEKGICSVHDLETAAATHNFEYEFLSELPYGDKNRLEGYLFPDTYEFYVNDKAENVIDKFLRNFRSKLTDELIAQLAPLNERLAQRRTENGFSEQEIEAGKVGLHEVIIVASLIEKETAKTSESASIAAVIYNRLCSKLYPCLQIDATIQYALGERKMVLTDADKGILSPYNTYNNAGLPAGPISNPGMGSIRAALYPADANYFFYALNENGVHHFSENYYEHQEFLTEMEGGQEETETETETNAPET